MRYLVLFTFGAIAGYLYARHTEEKFLIGFTPADLVTLPDCLPEDWD